MLQFDHIAISTNNLDETIKFYNILGYQIIKKFNGKDKWAALKLNDSYLEIFEEKDESKILHIAFNYENKDDLIDLLKPLTGLDNYDIYFGDLNREAFFIEDNNGISLQFIKKI